jgi:hypothetical protein
MNEFFYGVIMGSILGWTVCHIVWKIHFNKVTKEIKNMVIDRYIKLINEGKK